MNKYTLPILFVVFIISAVSCAPQYQKSIANLPQSSSADDLEEGANKEDLKGSASYGYGYYGYPLSYYGGYPFSYGLHGYYGGLSPYYGGYGFHGHYY